MIGDKIRFLRKQHGLSQEALGELVGFSQSKISKIERGERGDWDSLSDLKLLAAALEIPIEELVREEAMSGDQFGGRK